MSVSSCVKNTQLKLEVMVEVVDIRPCVQVDGVFIDLFYGLRRSIFVFVCYFAYKLFEKGIVVFAP